MIHTSDADLIALAERRNANRTAGLPLDTPTPDEQKADARKKRTSEKETQSKVYKILRAHGCDVYWLSQARETRQSIGLPDLIAFHVGAGLHVYFECKRPSGGVHSEAQREFQKACEHTGTRYVLGGVAEAWALVNDIILKERRG